MIKYCVYLVAPGSKEIQQFVFDTFKQAHKFECSLIYAGWSGCIGPDYPSEIDVPCYEQLRLF